jgi:DNA-directed RNA polymerase specialized sigma24 family protein
MHLVKMASITDIAKKLGVPERAVKSVITSGKLRLITMISKGDS